MTDSGSQPITSQQCRQMRERVGLEWESVARAWDKWEPYFASGGWPVTQKLVSGLRLPPDGRVLDVGCGVGDPSLQIAATVAPRGSVLAIDLCKGMVSATRRRAEVLGLTNIICRAAAAEELDEQPGTFDAVVSRFTLMFMPDVGAALRHVRSLLKPGGRFAASVWTPHETNPMFAIPCQQLSRVVELPKPQPGEPSAMRLARDGELAEALTNSGFSDVRVERVPVYQFARDPEDYWAMISEMAPTFRRQLEQLTDEQRQDVRAGLTKAVAKYASGPVIRVPALAQVGTASA